MRINKLEAKGLAALHRVAGGRCAVLTRRGKHVVKAGPANDDVAAANPLKGSIVHQIDAVHSTGEQWESDRG